MTVDEILATGKYTDRRGREWVGGEFRRLWLHPDGLHTVRAEQMRLLIERDLHRDECPSLIACENHPVPCVTIAGGPYGCFHVNPADTSDETYVAHECTHERAMDAARALAVSE